MSTIRVIRYGHEFEYEIIKRKSGVKVDIYKNAGRDGHSALANLDDGVLSVVNPPSFESGAHNSVTVDGAIVRGVPTRKPTPRDYGSPQFAIIY